MVLRVRRYFDVRAGEGRRVLFSFLYVAVVAASFLLARPIRNGLFLKQYGGVCPGLRLRSGPGRPVVFVPIYARVAARFGSRTVAVATLIFFSTTWCCSGMRSVPCRRDCGARLDGMVTAAAFYVWVNCLGVIAPVQAWSFANLHVRYRRARRLFGLIAVGASLGSIGAGRAGRVLVGDRSAAPSTCCWSSRGSF